MISNKYGSIHPQAGSSCRSSIKKKKKKKTDLAKVYKNLQKTNYKAILRVAIRKENSNYTTPPPLNHSRSKLWNMYIIAEEEEEEEGRKEREPAFPRHPLSSLHY